MPFNAVDAVLIQNVNTNQTFNLHGGRYAITLIASNYGASGIKLQKLALDNATYVDINNTAWTAATFDIQDLPTGQYRLSLSSGASGVYAEIASVAAS